MPSKDGEIYKYRTLKVVHQRGTAPDIIDWGKYKNGGEREQAIRPFQCRRATAVKLDGRKEGRKSIHGWVGNTEPNFHCLRIWRTLLPCTNPFCSLSLAFCSAFRTRGPFPQDIIERRKRKRIEGPRLFLLFCTV